MSYRTVLACSSIGAPERTAAGRTSPSSLPFITRFGTGVNNLLQIRVKSQDMSEGANDEAWSTSAL